MNEESITYQRNIISNKLMERIEKLFVDNGWEIFRTGENFTTLTFEAGTINDKPVYGSVKFTLHKSKYNLDEEIEKFEALFEEREINKKNKGRKSRKEN